jgi:hypothetical protein
VQRIGNQATAAYLQTLLMTGARAGGTLRNQDEPNIDDLLTIVTESVGAYKVCQARIDAVEKAMEKALSETAAPAKEPRSGA